MKSSNVLSGSVLPRLSRRRWIRAALGAIPAVAAGSAFSAKAQFFQRFSLFPGLTAEDMDRLNEASAKLNDHVPVGTMERWENPQSGNRGTVALIGTAEKDGHPCLKIRHNIKIKGIADPKVYIFNRCRMPDGSWKLF